MKVTEVLLKLESLGSPENVAGMARYGITTKKALGVPSTALKALAQEIKQEKIDRHTLALKLWRTGVHDARALAYLVDDPKQVTPKQMELWVADFDNWAICDSTCGTLFSYSPFAYEKVDVWVRREEEFVKRAGVVLMAWLAVHDKAADDEVFARFLPMLEAVAADERNFVKKAVSWSLRQIGKRSHLLNKLAIQAAERIGGNDSRAARWIAADALRELRSEKVRDRIEIKE